MSYKLSYFSFRGRGEQVRLMLHALSQPFEDARLDRQAFMALKMQGPAGLPFGSLPILDDGEQRLAQGPVIVGYLARKHGRCPDDLLLAARADTIALAAEDLRSKYFSMGRKEPDEVKAFLEGDFTKRWLNAFEGLLAQNDTGFFVGDSWTHADIAVWDVLDAVTTFLDSASTEGHDRVNALRQSIADLPALAEHLRTRPDN